MYDIHVFDRNDIELYFSLMLDYIHQYTSTTFQYVFEIIYKDVLLSGSQTL